MMLTIQALIAMVACNAIGPRTMLALFKIFNDKGILKVIQYYTLTNDTEERTNK
jgi:hypothetical protein